MAKVKIRKSSEIHEPAKKSQRNIKENKINT